MAQPRTPVIPWPPLVLATWGVVLLQAWASGRLHLLLQPDFHGLVLAAGLLLLLLALAGLRWPSGAGRRRPGGAVAVLLGTAALMLALPPRPSLSTLAANRGAADPGGDGLTFLLPPEQRTLTDWVRLLRQQPDPQLWQGEPVRVSGFVLTQPDEAPSLARMMVRCCLADATPISLAVRWPATAPLPPADRWLAVDGVMGVERHRGGDRSIVLARQVRPIPEPARPLEP